MTSLAMAGLTAVFGKPLNVLLLVSLMCAGHSLPQISACIQGLCS